jgi:hypothetical protein
MRHDVEEPSNELRRRRAAPPVITRSPLFNIDAGTALMSCAFHARASIIKAVEKQS